MLKSQPRSQARGDVQIMPINYIWIPLTLGYGLHAWVSFQELFDVTHFRVGGRLEDIL
jgi:hypothetical protein